MANTERRQVKDPTGPGAEVPTVMVEGPNGPVRINASKFDPEVHKKVGAKKAAAASADGGSDASSEGGNATRSRGKKSQAH